MSAPRTALARLSDPDLRAPRRPRVQRGGGDGGGFGSLTPEFARVLMLVAARASAITLLIIFILVYATLFASGGGMGGSSGAIAASWLAVHQVPLVIGKTGIGLWPLLPTFLMLWLVARDSAQAADSDCEIRDLGWVLGAAVGGPLLITAVCLAVAEDAAALVPLQPPDTLAAFAWVAWLNLLAAMAGIGSRRWREFAELLPIPLPDWVVPGARAGALAAGRLLAAAAVLTVVSFLAHWSRIGDTYHAAAGSVSGALGLTLLSLAYLPNIAVDGVSLLVGGQVRIGPGSLSLFAIDGAPVPAVPVAAAVPSGPVALWWLVLLLAPAAIGVLSGLECGRTSRDRATAPWATLTAAGVAAVGMALLGALAGGELGTFGRIGPAALSAVLVFVWFAVAGYVGLLGARWFGGPATAPAVADDEYADDEYDDYADDGYEYADDEYEDDYADDDYAEGEYADDDYDDEYDDYGDELGEDAPAPASAPGTGHHAESGWYDDEDLDDALDAELVDDQDDDGSAAGVKSADNPDIVDAEVVEGDLPDK
ncbi:cell division protein PerM [Nocardia sp. CA-145437]|uniref:cell division protein PerM n=1 Tax=Nocardia sp. CA-145437 TaxID=3239980 RepID=UPI003D9958B1